MTNAELIKALRNCASPDMACKGLCPYHGVEYCLSKKDLDAADALEAAEKRIAELEKRLPKEGEWIEDEYGYIHCSRCRMEWDEPEHPQTNFCPNCGAKMK